MKPAMWPAWHRLAQASIGLLVVIVIRSLGAALWSGGPATLSSAPQYAVYLQGAFAASVAALAALVLHAFDRDRLAVLATGMMVVALAIYKVWQVP